ncbi:DUF3857 domain-containing transglutaminase family protein [Brevundimonas sp.]|uniref:DUF3857 domain-containing transglutaminase family protein n=1 Tax=Brevundimonas sp. TaxID=1871086 RepID=UPI0040344DA1
MAFDGEALKAQGLLFGAAPAGFDMEPFDPGDRDLASRAERGSCFLLSDSRFDYSGPEPVYTSRLVQKVTGRDGLQSAASIEVPFNPAFETLVIHKFRVWRDGVPREAATPAAFEVLRRELNLERAVYDGRATAHMIIPDVRVGDVVDTAFSIIGANPVLQDRLNVRARLQWSAPTVETRVTVLCTEDRPITVRRDGAAPEPEDSVSGGVRRLAWREVDAPPYRHEMDEPRWHVGFSQVHVAEVMSWAEVSDAFRHAYEPPRTLPPDLEAHVAALAGLASPSERAVAALACVQDGLRYHSIGFGVGGFRPREIDQIWATRYGDCKDASRLCVAILRRLGLEAAPALVNTATGFALNEATPNLTAFDHCIVRLVLDGRTWWLDPTLSSQGGALATLTPVRMGWALPLIEGATLEPMPDGEAPLVYEAVETWTFPQMAADPARLTLRTTYRDWRADDVRRWAANDSPAEMARILREPFEKDYGRLTVIEPLTIVDDAMANLITLEATFAVESALIPGPGEGNVRFASRDDVVGPSLGFIESPDRSAPIDMGSPRRLITRRLFNFPRHIEIQPWSVSESGPGARQQNTFRWLSDRQAEQVLSLDLMRRSIPASEAKDYFRFARKAVENNGVNFSLPVFKGRLGEERRHGGWGVWIWMLIFGAALVFSILKPG